MTSTEATQTVKDYIAAAAAGAVVHSKEAAAGDDQYASEEDGGWDSTCSNRTETMQR